MKNVFLIGLLPAMIMGCGHPKVDTKAEGDKLMNLSHEWAKAALAHDVDKTLSYWADDAVLIESGQPVRTGKKELRQLVEESFKMPGFKISWEPQSVDVSQSGDMAYMKEKSQVTFNDSTGKAITMHSNSVTVWKKQADGNWKDVVDISSNEP
jgi:uncharacterized protein (TIGR02246 family)